MIQIIFQPVRNDPDRCKPESVAVPLQTMGQPHNIFQYGPGLYSIGMQRLQLLFNGRNLVQGITDKFLPQGSR